MKRFVMSPAAGERTLRFVGDQITFSLRDESNSPIPAGWQARLRTNLGRAAVLRHEIIHAHKEHLRLTEASWRDIPMERHGDGWTLTLPVTEPGFFQCKAYAIDPGGRQHWPEGNNLGISIHPDSHRTANTLYCAFPRMFGTTGTPAGDERWKPLLGSLDKEGFTVIPPSGKLRDVIKQLPHIVDDLGCRILHLLPINSTPTTYARFGRYGSPYACQDLLDVDPALVEFDKRTTGIDQFKELAYAAHLKGARVFIDIVINHTGWGSTLQETHPEWFVREEGGNFASPGAWGTVWEDLAELNTRNPALWEYLSDALLEWCGRGVDGFRCDAGYMIPVPAWRYITARVLDRFPQTIFFLEGLGGAWAATEELLTTGAMQWAYSELFQNYSGSDIARYLDYSIKQSERLGVYVHYSETHDNERLAKNGRQWSLLRNRLCALTSVSGAFGFTCGVEWLATDQIKVHQRKDMSWGNPDNILPELKQLNELISNHPCFFDGATLTRLSPNEAPVLVLHRASAEGIDHLLILVNTDLDAPHSCIIDPATLALAGKPRCDLLGQPLPEASADPQGNITFHLEPAACHCLAPNSLPAGLSGDDYRHTRAAAAWALTRICEYWDITVPGTFQWRALAGLAREDPFAFLAALPHLDETAARQDLVQALNAAMNNGSFPQVIRWTLESVDRITLVPVNHDLLIEDTVPFRIVLQTSDDRRHFSSVTLGHRHLVSVPRNRHQGLVGLHLERYEEDNPRIDSSLLFLRSNPLWNDSITSLPRPRSVLLTNGIGGMARLQINLGAIQSKYDCALAANLHASVPIDRHVFVKRIRAWIIADGFSTALDRQNLASFSPGPPATWSFVASAGNDRAVEINLTADMLDERNTVAFRFERPLSELPFGIELPPECNVSLILRCDIEDRNFHSETHRNPGADHHFQSTTHPIPGKAGFEFTPGHDRVLRCLCTRGTYHHEHEWSAGIPHPVEASRGQTGHGDAFSPGWFELPLAKGEQGTLILSADKKDPPSTLIASFPQYRAEASAAAIARAALPENDAFGRQLALAVQAFVVRRDKGKTVIAGYPWFLDWGRDSLIAARGLLAAGMVDTVRDLLIVFGRFAQQGTLPNAIHGEDASNRDTSDAPLWFGIVCEETAALLGPSLYDTPVNNSGWTLKEALLEIASGYRDGTPNQIRMDPASALIWSPSHFTWMDTNHPACTPRQGYPVEIQVLWIRLLRLMEKLDLKAGDESWKSLADRAEASLHSLFWIEDGGYLSDLLVAQPGQPAREALRDSALRSNCFFAISLGLLQGDRARRMVQAGLQYLVIPGALRSLAPLPVTPPLAIHNTHGHLLNDPDRPYCGRYEGDEDTSRKLAYHNGTAWTWTFPTFCEALAMAWDFDPRAVTAARSYLGSMDQLLNEGSYGHLPEIVDGDAPHTQRGCDAQAWSVTEALRVWKLTRPGSPSQPSRM